MKTAIQQALEKVEAMIAQADKAPDSHKRDARLGELANVKHYLQSLLPAEQKTIEDAYRAGIENAPWEDCPTPSDYFKTTYNEV